MISKNRTRLLGISLLTTIIALGGCASSQPKLTKQQIQEQYPQVARLHTAVNNSRSEGAELFAPESYNKAANALERAMDAAHNNNQEDANEAANKGLEVVDKLSRDTKSSRQILSEVLIARERVISAGAASLQIDKLTELDEKLKKTSTLVEDGNIEKAKQQRPQLIEDYTRLELATLKMGTADLAKSAIIDAKEQGAKKYAPKTLAQSEEKLALAVTILEDDRTQTTKANQEARNAKWLAEKSSSITETVKDFDRRDYTTEDVVLWYQSQLSKVNEPLGGQLPYNKPNDEVVATLRNAVTNVISEKNVALNQLKNTEDKYGKQLALTNKERLALEQKERADKQKFEEVQAMFTPKEANVYRQRRNVLISSHGFQFPSGQSEIQTANFPLMNKITRAIKIFPSSRIEVTGHTDSTGSDNINQEVSQARAEKVSKFLAEVGEIPKERITSRGYGESRPVATNKTAEGRAENRRVEINIINE